MKRYIYYTAFTCILLIPSLEGMQRSLTQDLMFTLSRGEHGDLHNCIAKYRSNRSKEQYQYILCKALFSALHSRNTISVSILLTQGASPNRADSQEEIPLITAVTTGSEECIDLLIDHGAYFSLDPTLAQKLFAKAAARNHQACIMKLMRHAFRIFRPEDELLNRARMRIKMALLVFNRLKSTSYDWLGVDLQCRILLASPDLAQDIAYLVLSQLNSDTAPLKSHLMTLAKDSTVLYLLDQAADCFTHIKDYLEHDTLNLLHDPHGTLMTLDDEHKVEVSSLIDPTRTREHYTQVVSEGLQERFLALHKANSARSDSAPTSASSSTKKRKQRHSEEVL